MYRGLFEQIIHLSCDRAAIRLAELGTIEILRKGKPVDPATARGVIRLRARAADAEA